MKTGIVLCSRSDSSRIPKKVFQKIAGIPLIEHLLGRLEKTEIPIILAIPEDQRNEYFYLSGKHKMKVVCGYGNDPLARMYHAAKQHGLDTIIRVTHDKIFIERELIQKALDDFHSKGCDYLYSEHFTDGSAFEIISFESLEKAYQKYRIVEYIGYAIRSVTDKQHKFEVPQIYRSPYRFLVDYDEDLDLLEVIFKIKGKDCNLLDAISFMKSNPWATTVNGLPKITVYTCVYNGEIYLEQCMQSVSQQNMFEDVEYILVDDCSSDITTMLIARFKSKFKNVKLIRNAENIGLSGSSNVALSRARGKYIIRLDADDYFTSNFSLQDLYREIEQTNKDAIYPDNYYGLFRHVQNGSESHHVGGTIFRTKAMNHIKFTDRLRGYEGLDFFERAKNQLDIGYYKKPIFFYRQRGDSMSKTNTEERARLKEIVTTQILA